MTARGMSSKLLLFLIGAPALSAAASSALEDATLLTDAICQVPTLAFTPPCAFMFTVAGDDCCVCSTPLAPAGGTKKLPATCVGFWETASRLSACNCTGLDSKALPKCEPNLFKS